ncbi:hypothetical protein [Kitasatospora purpeofusca]|uniref:hypothetical protein n=1 Tax=Kitasatospora purpeofusca TaxID=67352 RepID=UPI0036534502
MPWVKLDDRFPSHRKVVLLSDKAFRLYVSALCWSSENLTEGRIADRELPVVTRVRGVKAAAKELEEAGLWDREPSGWVIHDYLEYNPDRAKVQAEREAGKVRQQAWRNRKKAEKEAAHNGDRNAPRNGVTGDASDAGNDSSATRRRHDGDTTARETDRTNQQSSQVDEFRNAPRNAAPSRSPSPLPPTEVEVASKAARPSGPQVPDFARELVEELTAAGMVVGWRLGETEWFAVHGHIKRCGTAAMVEFARRRWNPADPPQTARYLTRIWADLPDMPQPEAGLPALRAVTGVPTVSRQQQETNDQFDRAAQRALARMQQGGTS